MGWAAMSNKMPGCNLANAWFETHLSVAVSQCSISSVNQLAQKTRTIRRLTLIICRLKVRRRLAPSQHRFGGLLRRSCGTPRLKRRPWSPPDPHRPSRRRSSPPDVMFIPSPWCSGKWRQAPIHSRTYQRKGE